MPFIQSETSCRLFEMQSRYLSQWVVLVRSGTPQPSTCVRSTQRWWWPLSPTWSVSRPGRMPMWGAGCWRCPQWSRSCPRTRWQPGSGMHVMFSFQHIGCIFANRGCIKTFLQVQLAHLGMPSPGASPGVFKQTGSTPCHTQVPLSCLP